MGLGSAQRTPAERLTYTSPQKRTRARAIVTRWVDEVPVPKVNWLSLKLTLESPTEGTVGVAVATIKTTGLQTANVMNGTHRVHVLPPSSSSTTKRSAPRSASVTQVRASSSGTRLDDATGFTHKDPVPIMPGSSPRETSRRCIVNAGMASTFLRKTMFVVGLSLK